MSRPALPATNTVYFFEENETKEINEDAIWRNIVSIFLQNHHRDDRGKLGYCSGLFFGRFSGFGGKWICRKFEGFGDFTLSFLINFA